jgi:hypothetical protein
MREDVWADRTQPRIGVKLLCGLECVKFSYVG